MNMIRVKSQKPQYVLTHCNDRNNSLHLACRR